METMLHNTMIVLTVKSGDHAKQYEFTKLPICIGRHPFSDVSLPNETVSIHHSRIERGEQGFCLFDMGSTNGTRVNGHRADFFHLADGDVIRLGDVEVGFAVVDAPSAAKPKYSDYWDPSPTVVAAGNHAGRWDRMRER